MEEITKSLTSLEKQIEDAKRNVAVQEGRKTETLSQLKNEFSLETIDEAAAEEERENQEFQDLEKEIRREFSALKEKYHW